MAVKTETQVLREICEWLDSMGYFFWRVNNIPVPGRARNKYTPKGLPDIMALWRGAFIAIEVKREGSTTEREANGRALRGGKLRPEQAEWLTKCTISGGYCFIVHSVDQLRTSLTEDNMYQKSSKPLM